MPPPKSPQSPSSGSNVWGDYVLPTAVAAGEAYLNYRSAGNTNDAMIREGIANRMFQERMRNTEWQAAVEDMRKAGLNPALAYSQGGASSPSGSMPSMTPPSFNGLSNAMQAIRMRKDLKLLEENVRNVQANTAKVRAEGDVADINRTIERQWLTWITGKKDYRIDARLEKVFQARLEKIMGDASSAQALGEQLRAQARMTGLDYSLLSRAGGLPRLLQMILK